MIPLIRSAADVRDIIGKLPHYAHAEKKPTALACQKSLKELRSLGKIPVKDYVDLTKELGRFLV